MPACERVREYVRALTGACGVWVGVSASRAFVLGVGGAAVFRRLPG